jgi:chromosomal replication initiation ATPase DnaA
MELTFYEHKAAEIFGCQPNDLFARTRFIELVEARYACFHYMRYHLKMSLYDIGKRFNLDHSSVCHGLKKVDTYNKTDKVFAQKFETFLSLLVYEFHTVEHFITE